MGQDAKLRDLHLLAPGTLKMALLFSFYRPGAKTQVIQQPEVKTVPTIILVAGILTSSLLNTKWVIQGPWTSITW